MIKIAGRIWTLRLISASSRHTRVITRIEQQGRRNLIQIHVMNAESPPALKILLPIRVRVTSTIPIWIVGGHPDVCPSSLVKPREHSHFRGLPRASRLIPHSLAPLGKREQVRVKSGTHHNEQVQVGQPNRETSANADLEAAFAKLQLKDDLQRDLLRIQWFNSLLWMDHRAPRLWTVYAVLKLVAIVGAVFVPTLVAVTPPPGWGSAVRAATFVLSLSVALAPHLSHFFAAVNDGVTTAVLPKPFASRGCSF